MKLAARKYYAENLSGRRTGPLKMFQAASSLKQLNIYILKGQKSTGKGSSICNWKDFERLILFVAKIINKRARRTANISCRKWDYFEACFFCRRHCDVSAMWSVTPKKCPWAHIRKLRDKDWIRKLLFFAGPTGYGKSGYFFPSWYFGGILAGRVCHTPRTKFWLSSIAEQFARDIFLFGWSCVSGHFGQDKNSCLRSRPRTVDGHSRQLCLSAILEVSKIIKLAFTHTGSFSKSY